MTNDNITNHSQHFVKWVNEKLTLIYNTNLTISKNLLFIRIKKKKNRLFSYETVDNRVTDPLLSHEINSFHITMDMITNSFKKGG